MWNFSSTEGLLAGILLGVALLILEVQGLRKQVEALIKLRFPAVFKD